MTTENRLVYRFYLFGLLLVLLNFCNYSFNSWLYESLNPIYTRAGLINWKLSLLIQILLSVVVITLISKTKTLNIYSEKLKVKTIKTVLLIALFFIIVRMLFSYHLMLVILPILFWLLLKFKKDVFNFLFRVNDGNTDAVAYELSFKNTFVIITKTLLLLSVSYEVLNIIFDVFILKISTMIIPTISLKLKLLALVLIYPILVLYMFLNKKSFEITSQSNKENALKLWSSILILYWCLVTLPYDVSFILKNLGSYEYIILLAVLLIISTLVNRTTIIKDYKNTQNINYEIIRSSLLVFSSFYLLYLLWDFYRQGRMLHELFAVDYVFAYYMYAIQFILLLLILIFNKKITNSIIEK